MVNTVSSSTSPLMIFEYVDAHSSMDALVGNTPNLSKDQT